MTEVDLLSGREWYGVPIPALALLRNAVRTAEGGEDDLLNLLLVHPC